jgi:chromosome partitioning protein
MSTERVRADREYSIGDAARLLGVSVAWIKDRETRAVLPEARRTRGGHRTYTTEELYEIRERLSSDPESGLPKRPEPLGARIAILNQKGGVGKTTVSQNLGMAFANLGYRSLLVDVDRQYNLTAGLNVRINDEAPIGLAYALCQATRDEDVAGILRNSVMRTGHPYADLIPTDLRMFDAEQQLLSDPKRVSSIRRLSRIMDPLAREYDLTIFDCPPDLGILTLSGILASEGVIVPVDHDFSLTGIRQLQGTIEEAAQLQRRVPILGVLINKFDRRTVVSQTVEEKVRRSFGDLLFRTRISQTTRIQESQLAKTPLLCYDPRHPVCRQFEDLAGEVVDRIRANRRVHMREESHAA